MIADHGDDAGRGFGVWERLPPSTSASGFSDHPQRMAVEYYGTAIRALLPNFLADLDHDRGALLASVRTDARAFAAAAGADAADGPRALGSFPRADPPESAHSG